MMRPAIDDVRSGLPDLSREAVYEHLADVLHSAQYFVDGDISGCIDDAKLRQREDIPPVLWQLIVYKARELAYATHYGGSLPEDGGQVTYWKRQYDAVLARVLDGEYDQVFGDLVIADRGGTARGV